jgi:hypothetical protein
MLAEEELPDKIKVELLNGIASTAVAVSRVNADSKNAAADREVKLALNSVLKSITGNPFMVNVNSNAAGLRKSPELPTIKLNPEEISTTLANLDINEFMAN